MQSSAEARGQSAERPPRNDIYPPRNDLKNWFLQNNFFSAFKKKKEPDTNVEPDRGFREEEEVEEEEEMINEEEEEKYYHHTHFNYDDIGTHGLEGEFGSTPTHVEPSSDVGEHHTKEMTPIVRPQRKRGVPWYQRTPFTVMQSTPKLKKITKAKKKKVVKSPEKANEDIVNEESNDVSNHLLLDSVEAASTLTFWKEWNRISSNLNTKHRLHMLTLDVEFWSRLLAVTDAGWLISSSALLMERRPTNARWTIFPQELNLQNGKTYFLRNIANGVGGHPKWKDVDMVLFPINFPHAHWFLVVLHLDIWKVHIYDSARCMNYFTTYLTGGEFKSFGDSIIEELDAIDYWKDFPDGHKDNAVVEFIDIVDAPQQEYITNRGDCGVFVSMYMEMIASGVPVKSDKPCRDARFLYRNRMTNIIWDTK
ncbi:unnamed protein product [Lactuca virosa]|uniref:Ubiquitin-like protease family profile domain-containing protein n=1 Tax=Lactuca virosa TaxID=75947 RepID=A0AAU9P732_9ASTR|nr:unnamed protein product [Lactuca virosa]